MRQSGYISSETLWNLYETDQVVVVSMWENIEAWEKWKNSETRIANEAEFKNYLIGETEYEYYSLGPMLD